MGSDLEIWGLSQNWVKMQIFNSIPDSHSAGPAICFNKIQVIPGRGQSGKKHPKADILNQK